MTDQTNGADADDGNASDADKQGAAPPADGSQGEGNGSPGKDWVKKSQFLAALKSATDQTEAVRRELEEVKRAQAKSAEKPPVTKADLDGLVASGDLTQAQADSVWEKQIIEKATAAARAEVVTQTTVDATARKVEAKLGQYRELVPEVWQKGSEEHEKVGQKFNELVAEGLPSSVSTELVALRLVYGEVEALRISKTVKRGSSESHQEQGGGGPSGGEGGGDGMPKGLTPQQKSYYQKGIEQGRYKSWADVKEELKYARKTA